MHLPQVMEAYYGLPVPRPGEELEFAPDPELQPVHYCRPPSDPLPSNGGTGGGPDFGAAAAAGQQRFVYRSAVAAAEAEAAEGLRAWTVACLCRSLSLDNIITFLAGALRAALLAFGVCSVQQEDMWQASPACLPLATALSSSTCGRRMLSVLRAVSGNARAARQAHCSKG